MPSPTDSPTDTLQDLGLNALEAEVYTFLLQQGEPVTAYRAGKALGKATANVYKAIEALALKGAVTVDDGEPRKCRAVAAEEFLGQLDRRFQESRQRAAEELRDLAPAPAEEGFYRLETVALVFERAAAMLRRAEKIVMVDAFPKTLEEMTPAIREAVDRGVEVRIQAYAASESPEMKISGAEMLVIPRAAQALGFWKSQQLNVVVDGKEALVALVSDDLQQVHQALWTDSLYLACILHAGLGMELTFHKLEAVRRGLEIPTELETILERQRFFYNSDLPGQELLFARHEVQAPGKEGPGKAEPEKDEP